MKERDQTSFVEAFASPKLGRNDRLDRVAAEVKWYRFDKLLGRLKPEGAGRPPYDALIMFKALLLQQWYALSDAALEEALNDRVSFRRFLGLSLEADARIIRRCAAFATV
jgi:transposase, IS5 family